ncbi:IS200/IS605 family transposase [Merismopedia glauca]|uniref:IS200/IS605 family transposase n=1 Tax=Merismopedia glauca CCAP 1448/3 TaxID=1296344 RepID=A0A2T1C7G4_9CYAN|nr:IS200/IS605 family transposase [Merismopedia glauca]PSB04225.1 IS200/IS605 family transposase [Merismopedia glauca CCAP 1448/3]
MQPNKGYRNAHCLKFHLVLVTKDRCKVIDSAMLERLEEIMRTTCQKWKCKLESFQGDESHVYLQIDFPPEVQLSKLINNLKTVSSRLIRKEFKACIDEFCKDAFWHGTYYIASCGGMTIEELKDYVEKHTHISIHAELN